MAKLRISIVEYLNTSPLVWGFTNGPLRGRYDLSFTLPSKCAESLRAGLSDIAIIPAIEYQRIPDLVVLPDMAIAAKREVHSLLLLSKKPIGHVQRIALDNGSRSTQALVKILCAERWRISPEFVESRPEPGMLAGADAALIIGDPALRLAIELGRLASPSTARPTSQDNASQDKTMSAALRWDRDNLFVYDVASEWRQLTGRPSVLALWAGRKNNFGPQVTGDFLASKEYGISHIDAIAADAATTLDLPAPALETYLRNNIDFSLDDENLGGLDLYFQKCARLNLIPAAKPLEFAPLVAKIRSGA